MNEIKNILICGLGAVGTVYAAKIQKNNDANLRILVDKSRLERYTQNPVMLNGQELIFKYILPDNKDFKADLIIIATKFDGLQDVIQNIKNFVTDKTIILSLLNGVTSEAIIAEKYGWDKLLLSYFIGHSAVREGRNITQDGIGKIVFGAKDETNLKNVEPVKKFFDKSNINYEIPEDMEHALWLKYMLNVSTNQPSSILNMTFGQMQNNDKFMEFSKKIMKEVQMIAKAEGVKNTEIMIDEALKSFAKMTPEGKTSMLQDVLAHRRTEVDMFAGTMIKFAQKHNLDVPYNRLMKEMVEIIHQNY